jgi:hypothetical protein
MDFSKWTGVIKLILLKVVDEIERRVSKKTGSSSDDPITGSLYNSLKLIIMDQVDHLVGEAVSYTKKQIDELALVVSQKVSAIMASLVYILILLAMILLIVTFLLVSASLYIGELLESQALGFLCMGIIAAILTYLIAQRGHGYLRRKILSHLTSQIQ